jgi:hypothetical protein
MSTEVRTDRRRELPPKPWTARAWVAVVLIPVGFAVALALGYALYDWFGYKPENDDAPLWVDLTTTLVVLAVSLTPCGAAVALGRHAARQGDRRGLVPLGIGALAGLALTILSIVDLIG